jgi:hypothetical protein
VTIGGFQQTKVYCLWHAVGCNGKRTMPDNLSATGEWIYQQAEHCARQANAQTDLKVKQQFLELKRLWLLLARAQSLTNSSELDRTADKMAKL